MHAKQSHDFTGTRFKCAFKSLLQAWFFIDMKYWTSIGNIILQLISAILQITFFSLYSVSPKTVHSNRQNQIANEFRNNMKQDSFWMQHNLCFIGISIVTILGTFASEWSGNFKVQFNFCKGEGSAAICLNRHSSCTCSIFSLKYDEIILF